MSANISLKDKSPSARSSLIAAVFSALACIGFAIYGIVYSVYFDAIVLLMLAIGLLASVGYAMVDKPVTEYLNLLAVVCVSFGTGLFFLNSYPVWADWYGQFNMYGSEGGIAPVIALLVLMVAAIIMGIISCFGGKEAE